MLKAWWRRWINKEPHGVPLLARPDSTDATRTDCPICGGDKRMLCSRCRGNHDPAPVGLRSGW